MLAAQKGKGRWEIGRDSSTQVSGDLKVGAKVPIQYRMTAASIDVKPAKVNEPSEPSQSVAVRRWAS
jgi:hypothetical protein